jgi:hypothetical protein
VQVHQRGAGGGDQVLELLVGLLSSESLQGAGKARGLVAFDGSDGISGGWLIELDDPSANGTFVWELP